jgi:hypothetical protein
MKRSDNIRETTVRQVTSLFEDILATLPEGCASLKTEPQKRLDGFSVALVPANEQSAEFGAMVLEGSLYSAFFGRDPTFTDFECPWELGLRRSAGLADQLNVIGKMCIAVIAGKCEHRFERRSHRGTIFVSETEIYRVADIPLLGWLRLRREVEVKQYVPYFPGAENHSRSFPRLSL